MNLFNLAQDNLLDIVCCLAEDPSPRNVLWLSKLAQTCKLFYELTKCSKVWLLLSKSWFQPEHYQNNRIAFIAEIFNYNYPNGSEEYNFTDVDCEQYTKCDKSCNANSCIIFVNTNGKSANPVAREYNENEKKITHAMLICMRRLYKGKKGISYDENGNWIFDIYYETLAKKISFPSETVTHEIQKYSSNIFERITAFNNKINEFVEICRNSHMSIDCIIKHIIDIVPARHFTRNMHYGAEKYGCIAATYKYIEDFAHTETKLDALKVSISSVISTFDTGILTYITGKTVIFLINSYMVAKACFKYIAKGIMWLRSFIY